jgi:hypothetical protein
VRCTLLFYNRFEGVVDAEGIICLHLESKSKGTRSHRPFLGGASRLHVRNSRDRSTIEILHNNHLNMAESSEVPAQIATQDVQLRTEQPVAGSGEVCSVPSTV